MSSQSIERKINDGRRVLVGVNAYTEGDSGDREVLYIGPETEEAQLKRLGEVRRHRDQSAVDASLARVASDAADTTMNLMPAILDATLAYATQGEIIATLQDEFGTWTETTQV